MTATIKLYNPGSGCDNKKTIPRDVFVINLQNLFASSKKSKINFYLALLLHYIQSYNAVCFY